MLWHDLSLVSNSAEENSANFSTWCAHVSNCANSVIHVWRFYQSLYVVLSSLLVTAAFSLAFLLYFLNHIFSINLTIPLVFLLGCSSGPWCQHRLCSFGSFGQADAQAADSGRRLHPAVLLSATQGTPLHYLHVPHLQPSGSSWLFLCVSDDMTGLIMCCIVVGQMMDSHTFTRLVN